MSSKTITGVLISITLMLLCCNGNTATPIKRQDPVSIAQQKAIPKRVSDIMLYQGLAKFNVFDISICKQDFENPVNKLIKEQN